SERTQEGALGATFVARRWRTFASVRLAAELKWTHFVTIPDTSLATICPACDGRDPPIGSVPLAVTHVGLAPLAVSHQDGFRWSAGRAIFRCVAAAAASCWACGPRL